MGLRAISNAVLDFKDVRVPAENLIGQEGRGLKIALTTLNDGRLSIPNICVGTAKACLAIVRRWAGERVQWGKPIGRHEAIAHKIADIAGRTFAMESVASLATELSDRGGHDIRLEAAAAKEWNTFRGWEIVDETMQIRGGRGYETEHSLAARGEEPIPVERMMRDFRINKIFEGSTEIMHLFMAREMVDEHLAVAGALIDPDKPLAAEARRAAEDGGLLRVVVPHPLAGLELLAEVRRASARSPTHLRFVERASRKLARASFHGMLVYQATAAEQAGLPVPAGGHRQRDLRHGRVRGARPRARRRRAPGGGRGRARRRRLLPLGATPRPRAAARAVGQRRRGEVPVRRRRLEAPGWLEAGASRLPEGALDDRSRRAWDGAQLSAVLQADAPSHLTRSAYGIGRAMW